MSVAKNYFGTSILGLGGLIDKGQTMFYLGRVSLMSIGAMTLEYMMAMSFDGSEIFSSVNLFTGKVMEAGPQTLTKVLWVLFAVFLLHFAAFFMMGWKKHKKTRDGDDVARSLFEDVNVTIIDKEAK